jgi:Bacterial membrane protein YfhO
VTSISARVIRIYQRVPPTWTPLVVIVLIVLVANAAYVLRLTNNDPIVFTAHISQSLCHIACGRSSIDPNVGPLTQDLGHRAALDVIHGHLPWWNQFEGLGTPLAGELQSAALFPFTWLLAFPAGLVWMHIILEALAGITTYFLLRRLSIPTVFAVVGSGLFALDGTFAWLANTVVNPLAFLPMLLLGVEIILERSSTRSSRGWTVAVIALALSLYSGFPEGAYFDALFCGVWALVRLFTLDKEYRLRALWRLAIAAGLGITLALPTLVPFLDFLKVAYVGGHTSAVDGLETMHAMAIPMLFNPYVYGTIFDNAKAAGAWDTIGGYFTVSATILAIVGLFGARLRGLRVMLAAWFVVGLAGTLNFLHSRVLWNIFPFVSSSAFSRYIFSSCELAIIILAVLGLTDVFEHRRSRRYLTYSALFMALVLVWGWLVAEPYNRGIPHHEKVRIFLLALRLIPFVTVALLIAFSLLKRWAWSTYLVAAVVVGESLFMFMVPTVAAPKAISIDYAPIHYLQTHEGEYRYVDLGVIAPNWGSEFGLNSLTAIDLPFPSAFKTFIQDDLYPGLRPPNEFLVKDGPVGTVALEDEVAAHFHAYENASVKYLVLPSTLALIPQLSREGLRTVFHDAFAIIYETPHPRPFFSSSTSCAITSTSVNQATATCSGAHASVLRTELSMTGWTVSVNSHAAKVTTVDGVYQRVTLPPGTSTVRCTFYPPHENLAILLALVGFILVAGSLVLDVRSARRREVPPEA